MGRTITVIEPLPATGALCLLVSSLLLMVTVPVSAFTTQLLSQPTISTPMPRTLRSRSKPLYTFYDDFEDFNKDDDDDDDDEDDIVDDQAVADFRAKMGTMFGGTTTSGGDEGQTMSSVDELIQFARSQSGISPKVIQEWAKPVDKGLPGTVLVANPDKFCQPSSKGIFATGPSPSLLAKFGLTRPPPKDLGPDRQADLLPVLVVVERDEKKGCRGVLLNRRTGYLLGDLEQPPPALGEQTSALPPILEKFCIQPLWFGGIDNISSGLDMLHLCPTVKNAQKLTEDGLFWGGDPAQAQEAMEDPSLDRIMTGFDFKFFVQSTIWSARDLDKEIQDGIWFPASVSKEVLFKSRDRMGTQKAKPLWTEIMELMGGEFQTIKDNFYRI
jgi:putative AlgH/UPF0301 family transcriptional regulator